MKFFFVLFVSIFFCSLLPAQNAQVLVAAEKTFEKSCLESGIRNGFLANVDSNGIEFTEKGPTGAKQFWTSLPPFDGIFSWSPTYAELSVSGNWGYTTGNYEHRPKTLKDAPDECGQYTTLWGKNDRGEWKYLIDIGNAHDCSPLDKSAKFITIGKYNAGQLASEEKLSGMEAEFSLLLARDIGDAYLKYGSSKYILNLSKHHPIMSTDSAVMILNKMGIMLKYRPVGVKISPGKDMAAVYGTLDTGSKTGNYVRIWRHEKSGWKIALEVIRV